MKLAFLYAGQGSQKAGMGQDFYQQFPQIRDVFDNTAADIDLKELCFNSALELLSQTQYTQPCMAAFAIAVSRLLAEQGIEPEYCLGLSLGEYCALYKAGVFSEEQLLAILAYRGRVMSETTSNLPTKMTAILGLAQDLVEKAVAEADEASKGLVVCANYNCPGQIVIGGERSAVDLAELKCQEYGAKRCIPLAVSGPFHTPYLQAASQLLQQRFVGEKFAEMNIPVIFNTSADLLGEESTVAVMLVRQVVSPVRFEQSIRRLEELGVDTVIEIGPGKVLSGFVKKTAPAIKCYAIEDIASLEQTLAAIKGEQ